MNPRDLGFQSAMIKCAISYDLALRVLRARLKNANDVVARGGGAVEQVASMKKYHRAMKHWNARGFGDGPMKPPWVKSAAVLYANTLTHPDVKRWRALALAGTLAGATAGAGATALAMRKKKRKSTA